MMFLNCINYAYFIANLIHENVTEIEEVHCTPQPP